MNRNLFKAGAFAGVVSVAALAAGPALAAAPVSQARANGLNIQLAGNKLISGETLATNNGKQAGHGDVRVDNTLPQVAGALPGTNVAGVGVVLQDAWADKDGNSAACAGAAGQGSGLVSVGSKPCSVKGNQTATLDLASLDLGNLVADPSSIVGQILNAIPGINGIAGTLQDTLVGQLTSTLSSTLGNVGLNGSLGAVAGMCSATPDSATGSATIADSHLGLTVGNQKFTLVDFPANPDPNTHVLTNLDKVTQVVLDAVQTQVENLLATPLQDIPNDGTPLGQLAALLKALPLVDLTGALSDALKLLIPNLQNSLITPLVKALQPLLQPLEKNVLDITLNKQPVPQKAKTFETTALDLQVLPALKQFTGGSSLVGGTIGHVICGPNSRLGAPSESPSPSNSPSPSKTPSNHIPTNVDSGMGGNSHANEILAAVAALLALAGAGGTLAYRRYGMPRG